MFVFEMDDAFSKLLEPTERLQTRRLMESDSDGLFEIYSNTEAMKFRGSKSFKSHEDAFKMISESIVESEDIKSHRLGIMRNSQNRLIGTVVLKSRKSSPQVCEIGFSLDEKQWRKGFATEFVSGVLACFKRQSYFTELRAWVVKENVGSVKIFEQLEFKITSQNQYPGSFLYFFQRN